MDKRLTREELYKLVWSTPVIQAAKDLGISGVALAKRCRREAVPLPPRGHWARVRTGRQIVIPPLLPKPTKASVPPQRKSPPPPAAEPKPLPRIAARRSRSRLTKGDRIETFWCKLDRCSRHYSFGVNWHPSEYNEESWSEHDRLVLFATIHSKTKRPYRLVEVWLLPTRVAREKINPELTAIGNVWTVREKKGWLLCSASVPADASLPL